MSECVYSVCIVLCVRRGFTQADPPVQVVLPTGHRLRNRSEAKRYA
jgi:hypothetical protein